MTRTLGATMAVALLLLGSAAQADTPFSQSACWDESCPDELAACQAHPLCVDIAQCIQSGAGVAACYDSIGSPTASGLYTAIQECGWEACATTEGSCKGVCSYFGPTVCNCDSLCETYGDCCQDYWDLCWEPEPPCEPACGAKECGDDGCGGSCGSCPFNAVCDGSGTCNDQCEAVCELGATGCEGTVAWTCTPGPGGCPKKTTVDCAGAQMICDHGGCVQPAPTPDVTEPDPDVPSAPDVVTEDLGPETDPIEPQEDTAPEPNPDTAAETTPLDEDTLDGGAGASTTQTASSPTVVREGCGGAPQGPPIWIVWLALVLRPFLNRLRSTCFGSGAISTLR